MQTYRAAVRRTLLIYLFSLPFQPVQTFRWYTIPGVAVAAYIYLGWAHLVLVPPIPL